VRWRTSVEEQKKYSTSDRFGWSQIASDSLRLARMLCAASEAWTVGETAWLKHGTECWSDGVFGAQTEAVAATAEAAGIPWGCFTRDTRDKAHQHWVFCMVYP
jgi:hypothetical protein